MYAFNILLLFFVFTSATYQGLQGLEDGSKSNESLELSTETKPHSDLSAEGPPDSHEAMNNRELKPKLTTSDRKKRSYQFLMGLVKRNNSGYEVTNEERDFGENVHGNEAKASELLLELMIKIAENPDQWRRVHDLLQKIDKDLVKSKEIVENSVSNTENKEKLNLSENDEGFETVKWIRVNNTVDPQQLEETNQGKRNATEKEIGSTESETTKFPWQITTKPVKSYQKNFAYHRVTGNPLIHSNLSKNPKAYIAVSVIAPKPMQHKSEEDELMLENELKDLKPWTHRQNLKNMAQIRSRWVIQTNEKKELYGP